MSVSVCSVCFNKVVNVVVVVVVVKRRENLLKKEGKIFKNFR